MAKTDTFRHQGLRDKLCDELRSKGITDEAVLRAIRAVPRHWFLDEALDNIAYEDTAVTIARNQTISHPSTVAAQTALLQLQPNMRVLEIGTGSGYQTAILCEMGARVYSIERHKPLYESAKKLLSELHYNARCFNGDGFQGLADYDLRRPAQVALEGREKVNHNIFDRIIITCGAPYVPKPLMQQLKPEGIMVIPIEDPQLQDQQKSLRMFRIVKHGEDPKEWELQQHGLYEFVPMLNGKQR